MNMHDSDIEIPSPLTEEFLFALVNNHSANSLEDIRLLHDFLYVTSQQVLARKLVESDRFQDRNIKEQIKLVFLAGGCEHAPLNRAISEDPGVVYELLQRGYSNGEYECSVLWLWYVQYIAHTDSATANSLALLSCFEKKRSLISTEKIQASVREIINDEARR